MVTDSNPFFLTNKKERWTASERSLNSLLFSSAPTPREIMGQSVSRKTLQFHEDAAAGRDQSVAVFLCDEAIDSNRTVGPDARTVLHKAARAGHYEVCDVLLTFKGVPPLDVNQRDANGSTALHAAASEGRLRIVKRLCGDERIDAAITDRYGETALHDAAARKGRGEIIAALLAAVDASEPHNSNGTDVNARSVVGATPLHKAMSAGLEENVQALLKAPGIDVNARDGEGDTALHEVGETFASKSRKHSAVHSISPHGSLCPLFVDALSPR